MGSCWGRFRLSGAGGGLHSATGDGQDYNADACQANFGGGFNDCVDHPEMKQEVRRWVGRIAAAGFFGWGLLPGALPRQQRPTADC